ncbi:DUF177 domain-containing protein [Aggregicoccus sp. 17bor-14]|uniref:YceD family protein n=1 Tax=Myxococcaceae TaxID=31 RepID=UPI00129D0164|nr:MULTISPECIES: DUF177 domain-containing protein [Myxococcaceae]MBF5046373.1 DUF177 domain-containing protein [Simulacricoccus sp. 17bor-14]MRI92093.1 DUF177 domain-containing protein [Aggregicoccus sp. 17bor-14]
MVVKIEQIREEGLRLDEPVSTALIQEALDLDSRSASGAETGFKATGPARLKAFLRKVSGGVLLEGSLDVSASIPCKRCLVDVKLDVPVRFTLNLVPESLVRRDEEEGVEEHVRGGEGESEGSFDLQDTDEEVFDGKTIDLDPIVREQVLLALPMSVVCREDCQGLCAQCGQNLNEKKCGCEQRVIDPRLAALKDIKLN